MKYLLQGQLVKLAKEINGLNPLRDMTAMVALVMAPLLPRIRAGSGNGEENMGGGSAGDRTGTLVTSEFIF